MKTFESLADLATCAGQEGGMQLAWRTTIKRADSDKPVCVAEPVSLCDV
jgi:hypothetical protein